MDYPWSSESFTPAPFEDHWLAQPLRKTSEVDIKYEFLHDKVQEACYEMIPEDELPVTHLNIGRNLKEHSIHSDEALFEICNHIGAGQTLLQHTERSEMALLNLNAARKAMTRAAFEHALRYSLAARALLMTLTDGADEKFSLGVNQVIVQSLFSLARYTEALGEAEHMMRTTKSDLGVVVIGVEKIRALRSLGRNRDAYEQGMKIIKSVGLQVPNDIWNVDEIISVTMSYKNNLDTEETMRVLSLRSWLMTDLRISAIVTRRENAVPAAIARRTYAVDSNGTACRIFPCDLYLGLYFSSQGKQWTRCNIYADCVRLQSVQSRYSSHKQTSRYSNWQIRDISSRTVYGNLIGRKNICCVRMFADPCQLVRFEP
jgi:hypothetical protein